MSTLIAYAFLVDWIFGFQSCLGLCADLSVSASIPPQLNYIRFIVESSECIYCSFDVLLPGFLFLLLNGSLHFLIIFTVFLFLLFILKRRIGVLILPFLSFFLLDGFIHQKSRGVLIAITLRSLLEGQASLGGNACPNWLIFLIIVIGVITAVVQFILQIHQFPLQLVDFMLLGADVGFLDVMVEGDGSVGVASFGVIQVGMIPELFFVLPGAQGTSGHGGRQFQLTIQLLVDLRQFFFGG